MAQHNRFNAGFSAFGAGDANLKSALFDARARRNRDDGPPRDSRCWDTCPK